MVLCSATQPNGRKTVNRAEKQAFVDSFNAQLAASQAVVVTHYRGLTVKQMEDLRVKMRESGASIRVVKNRLAKRAFEGTTFGVLESLMTGPTALAFSNDPVAAAIVAYEFAKGIVRLVILGGAMGDQVLSVAEVKALATLP